MQVWIYQSGDTTMVFGSREAATDWIDVHDPEGVAFVHEVDYGVGKRDELNTRIDEFLADFKESKNGYLAEVSSKDMEQLTCIINLLIWSKFESDPDSCYPIDFRLENIKLGRFPWVPFVPHMANQEDMPLEEMFKVMSRLEVAVSSIAKEASTVATLMGLKMEKMKK